MNFPRLSELNLEDFEIAPPDLGDATLPQVQNDPSADPAVKPVLHDEITKCQHCGKERDNGESLFRCGGCRVGMYCVRLSRFVLSVSLIIALTIDDHVEQRMSKTGMANPQSRVQDDAAGY